MGLSTQESTEGTSYLWAFFLFVGLFLASAFGSRIGLPDVWRAILACAAGATPLFVQLASGYGLGGRWVALYSRVEHPREYWLRIVLSAAVAAWFAYAAYEVFL
jgi:hypothetical protein